MSVKKYPNRRPSHTPLGACLPVVIDRVHPRVVPQAELQKSGLELGKREIEVGRWWYDGADLLQSDSAAQAGSRKLGYAGRDMARRAGVVVIGSNAGAFA